MEQDCLSDYRQEPDKQCLRVPMSLIIGEGGRPAQQGWLGAQDFDAAKSFSVAAYCFGLDTKANRLRFWSMNGVAR